MLAQWRRFTYGEAMRVILFLLCAGLLWGCSKEPSSADAGSVRSVASIVADGKVTRPELSDPNAVAALLDRALAEAPPIDTSRQTSSDVRRKFYVGRRAALIGERHRFWFVISCNALKGSSQRPLSFDLTTKNIRIHLYTGSDTAQRAAQTFAKLAQDQSEIWRAALNMQAEVGASPNDVDSHDAEQAMVQGDERAGTIDLPGGPSVWLLNSPISATRINFGADWAETQLHWSQARLSQDAHGQDTFTSVLDELTALRSKWLQYPESFLPAPFWSAMVPYAGDPKRVCLAGGFQNIDLRDGGEATAPFVNSKARLVADLSAWVLYDRDTGATIKSASL